MLAGAGWSGLVTSLGKSQSRRETIGFQEVVFFRRDKIMSDLRLEAFGIVKVDCVCRVALCLGLKMFRNVEDTYTSITSPVFVFYEYWTKWSEACFFLKWASLDRTAWHWDSAWVGFVSGFNQRTSALGNCRLFWPYSARLQWSDINLLSSRHFRWQRPWYFWPVLQLIHLTQSCMAIMAHAWCLCFCKTLQIPNKIVARGLYKYCWDIHIPRIDYSGSLWCVVK